ncbi:hypothetical protein ENBRE01_1791 [Enteropsectra breve]|nr:hypothetical protein ENBRE01_1791 [Enteropsectra breve]
MLLVTKNIKIKIKTHHMMYGIRLSVCLLAWRLISVIAGVSANNHTYAPLDPTFLNYQFPVPSEVKVYRTEDNKVSSYSLFVSGKFRGWMPKFKESALTFEGEGYRTFFPIRKLAAGIPVHVSVFYPDVDELVFYQYEIKNNEPVLTAMTRNLDAHARRMGQSAQRYEIYQISPI